MERELERVVQLEHRAIAQGDLGQEDTFPSTTQVTPRVATDSSGSLSGSNQNPSWANNTFILPQGPTVSLL